MRITTPSSAELKLYRKAGQIASTVMKGIRPLVQPGKEIIKICEEAESKIRKNGGKPAFPLNVSVNNVAAHYTSPLDDRSTIPEKGLVKVDLGVSINGYLVDTATTIDLSYERTRLVETAEQALKAAISSIRAGTSVGDVGKTINSIIGRAELKPISNLTGHSIARYELHSGTSVPNISMHFTHVMREGEIYAIEPFVTEKNGKGFVKETRDAYIFSCKVDRSPNDVRDSADAEVLNKLRREFDKLPFALRWLNGDIIDLKGIEKLVKKGNLVSYPVLVEAGNKLVAQAEHTLVVSKSGCEVLTA
ncbi:MAG: type II methionyl aminopeptidase [Candidatus Atabeyarchaeum deiterrae]